MAQEKALKFPGLITQYNSLALAPGALVRANDCSIRRENVIEDRRGHKLYSELSNQTAQLMVYDNKVISHNSSVISYDNGSGTFANYSGNYEAPTGRKMRHLEASSNLYVTTSAGVKVFTDVAGTAGRLAGAPRALNATYTTTGATGFLANGENCAYRSVIKRTDANENVLRGYPSQRLWVTNSSGGARNIALTVYLPSDAIAGDTIEVYRTEAATGTSTDNAGDEMALVYQYETLSADISTGSVTFTDSVTDALRGAALYSNPSEEGIAKANDRPPLAKDICLYKVFMLFANTKTKHRLFSTLVGAGKLGFSTTGNTSSNTTLDSLASTTNLAVGWKVEGAGIPAGTTVATITSSVAIVLSQAATVTATGVTINFYTNQSIVLASSTYAFGSTEITSGAGSPQIKVSVTGVAASDIDLTARSIEYVVNRFATNTSIYAYYISGPNDTPGKLMFEERGLGAAAFTIQASNSTIAGMFFPSPPTSPATSSACTSSQDERVNAVYVAKSQQNEHVPALDYLLIGPSNKEILRVVALRDSAIVIKEEGVYRITGDTFANMVVTPIDLTVYCNAADSVAVLANQVFMLSNQGIVLISESGVQVISREIEPSLLPILNSSYLAGASYGAAYESERSYYLTTLSNSLDTYATQTLVYNIFTRTWVRHTYAMVSGVVEPAADKLYFAKRSDTDIYVERKDFSATDYADPEFDITITTLTSPDTVEFTLTGDTPEAGWIISQNNTDIEIDTVTSISGSTYRAVLVSDYPGTWATGAAEIFPSVGMDIEFHSFTGGQSPDVLKQVRAVGIFSDDIPGNNSVTSFIATFRTNFDPEAEEITLEQPSSGWGGAWGAMPWGGSGDSHGYPTWVPRNKQYCTRMNLGIKHQVARERMVITGVGYVFEPVSDRIGR
jgi:hypothetical protein